MNLPAASSGEFNPREIKIKKLSVLNLKHFVKSFLEEDGLLAYARRA